MPRLVVDAATLYSTNGDVNATVFFALDNRTAAIDAPQTYARADAILVGASGFHDEAAVWTSPTTVTVTITTDSTSPANAADMGAITPRVAITDESGTWLPGTEPVSVAWSHR